MQKYNFVIPARAGSKRIIKKNIRMIAGKPLLGWTIEKIKSFQICENIFVSTDSLEIAEIAQDFGAKVPFLRPKNLADDHTSTLEVMKYSVNEFFQTETKDSITICVYPASFFLEENWLKTALSKASREVWEFVFAGAEQNHSPYRSFRKSDDGSLDFLFPDHISSRSQELPRSYVDAALFYVGKNENWLQAKQIISPRSTFIRVPMLSSLDLNTPEDWDLFEILFESRNKIQNLLRSPNESR